MTTANILIIDDNVGTCETLSDIFEEKGYIVTTANSGSAAIKEAEKAVFDLALIDINLPDMDGVALLREFTSKYPEMASIIITGYASVENAINALKDGASGYFVKPLAIDEVAYRVSEILEKKRLERELKESEEKYRLLFENMVNGFALHEIVTDEEGKPIDYVFLEVNSLFEKLTGLKKEDLIGKKVTEALPGTEKDPADWIGRYGKVALTGEETRFENYSESLDKWYSVYAFSPRKGRFAVIFEDITEKKKAEEALKESENRFRNTYESAPVGIILADKEGKIFNSNPDVENILGFSEEELITMRFKNFSYPGEELEENLKLFDEMREGKRNYYRLEKRYLHKNGNTVWAHLVVSAVRNEEGEFQHCVAIIEDITEKKKAETMLTRFGRILEDSLNEIFIFDSETFKFIQVNRGARENLGYTLDELKELTPLDLKDEFTLESFKEMVTPLISGEKKIIEFITTHKRKDGSFYPVEVHLQLLSYENTKVYIAIILDITERKKAEEALSKSEALVQLERDNLRDIIRTMRDGVYIVNADWDIEYINPAIEKNFGPTEGRKCYEYFHDRTESCPWCKNSDVFAGKTVRWEWTSPKTGQTFDLFDAPFHNPDGHVSKIEFFLDITERKKAEEALKKSELKYKTLFNSTSEAIFIHDMDGNILEVNDIACDRLGYSREEFLKMTPQDIESPDHAADVAEKLKRMKEEGGFVFEGEHITKDGKRIPVEISTIVIEYGKKPAILGVARDITERKKIEEERAEHLYFLESIKKVTQAIQDTTDLKHMMSDTLDLVLNILNCDRAWLFYPCDPDTETWSVPMSRWRPEWPSLAPADGIPMLPEVAEILKVALENPEPVRTDPQTGIYLPSQARFKIASQMFMAIYPRIGKPWVFGVHQCSHPRIWTEGDARIFKEIASRITDALSNLLLFKDLQESKDSLSNAQEMAHIGNWDWNLVSQELNWSDETFRSFGLVPGEIVPTFEAFEKIVHPEDIEFVKKLVNDAISNIKPFDTCFRIISKDGSVKTLHSLGEVVFSDGKPVKFFGTQQDITERKKAESELKLHELRLQSMLKLNKMTESSEEEIMDYVADEIIKMSRSRFSFIGMMNEDETVQIINSLSRDVMLECAMAKRPFEFPVENSGIWGEAVRQRKTIVVNDYANTGLPKKGYPKGHVELTRLMSVPIFEGKHIISVSCVANKETDYNESDVNAITSMLNDMWRLIQRKRIEEEKKNLWDQLLQSQKLESIGRLTGGIAHDFNNILTGILGYGELALRSIDKNNPLNRNLKIIIENTERATNLVKQLLAFSRKQVLAIRINNLNTIIDNMGKMLKRVIGEDIKLTLDIHKAVNNVKVDTTQIEQILLNLTVNARDAMPSGGNLTIKTDDVNIDEEYAKSHKDLKPGPYVMLSVEDTGTGMDKEVQGKIFEPFFTTKEMGKGSGLGLSTVFGIVKQHNGSIWIYSEPGKGSVFKIYFPVAVGTAETLKTEPPTELMGGDETILIVDDEAVVLSMTKELLDELGYSTLEARSGEEALQISNEFEGTIDLMFSDVIMTGMNGWELANEIFKNRPDIKVIFSSGYMDNPVVLQNILEHDTPFINKPFRPQTLAAKIREVLDAKT